MKFNTLSIGSLHSVTTTWHIMLATALLNPYPPPTQNINILHAFKEPLEWIHLISSSAVFD